MACSSLSSVGPTGLKVEWSFEVVFRSAKPGNSSYFAERNTTLIYRTFLAWDARSTALCEFVTRPPVV